MMIPFHVVLLTKSYTQQNSIPKMRMQLTAPIPAL